MSVVGLSLVLAAILLCVFRPPMWLVGLLGGNAQSPPQLASAQPDAKSDKRPIVQEEARNGAAALHKPALGQTAAYHSPSPLPVLQLVDDDSSDGETTPTAKPILRNDAVPSFALSPDFDDPPKLSTNGHAQKPAPLPSTVMPPPPPRRAPPTLSGGPSRSGQAVSSRLPAPTPARAPGTSTLPLPSSSLAPPPTHSKRPTRPPSNSKGAVVLAPGRSPLDWARLSADPTADLAGLGPSGQYLRVTPAMLRTQTGRRGKPAWMALGGRVYNVSPYLEYHPGGEPELLRGAGRDGTRLFGEVHPWVNFEGMLASCLVGVLVADDDTGGGEMEEMD